MNELTSPMLLYYVIYYEKFRKIMQQTEKVALKCYLHHHQVLLYLECSLCITDNIVSTHKFQAWIHPIDFILK